MRPRKIQIWALLLTVGFAVASCSIGKSVVNTPPPATLTMECIQLTGDGNLIVEVQGDGRNIENATEAALKYAVRGLLFEGISGSTVNRIQSQHPLVKDAEVRLAKQDYFQNLFDSGDYRLYVESLPNMVQKVVKVSGGYKVKVLVILKKQLLRKRLEKDGIIKSLGSSF